MQYFATASTWPITVPVSTFAPTNTARDYVVLTDTDVAIVRHGVTARVEELHDPERRESCRDADLAADQQIAMFEAENARLRARLGLSDDEDA